MPGSFTSITIRSCSPTHGPCWPAVHRAPPSTSTAMCVTRSLSCGQQRNSGSGPADGPDAAGNPAPRPGRRGSVPDRDRADGDLAPGSYLVISHPASDIHPAQAEAQKRYNEHVSTPQTLRTRDEGRPVLHRAGPGPSGPRLRPYLATRPRGPRPRGCGISLRRRRPQALTAHGQRPSILPPSRLAADPGAAHRVRG